MKIIHPHLLTHSNFLNTTKYQKVSLIKIMLKYALSKNQLVHLKCSQCLEAF